MDFKYLVFDTVPNDSLMEGIVKLYSAIFDSNTKDLIRKINNKTKLLFNIVLDGEKVIGFKIGYELDKDKFYSWLGAVDTTYRNNGIASKMMIQQHQYLKELGYKVVQTKTMNKWRNMLILNIKSGFDVIETITDENGLHKIVLEKSLLN